MTLRNFHFTTCMDFFTRCFRSGDLEQFTSWTASVDIVHGHLYTTPESASLRQHWMTYVPAARLILLKAALLINIIIFLTLGRYIPEGFKKLRSARHHWCVFRLWSTTQYAMQPTAKMNKVKDLALIFWSVSLPHQDIIFCQKHLEQSSAWYPSTLQGVCRLYSRSRSNRFSIRNFFTSNNNSFKKPDYWL